MATFTDEMIERFLSFDAQLTRLEEGEALKVRRRLDELEREIRDLVKDLDDDQLRVILTELAPSGKIGSLIEEAFRDIRDEVDSVALRLARVAETVTLNVMNEALGGGSLLQPPAVERLRSASDLVIEGRPARDWWSKQSDNFRKRYGQAVREGLAEEETIPEVLRRIRGTKANRYRDGVMNITRHHAMTLVRTSVFSVSNDARAAVFDANRDLVAGRQAINPLDRRTTVICMARAGKAWSITGEPMVGTDETYPGPPPWHMRCRTVEAPIFRPVAEMSGISDATRERLKRLRGRRLDGKPAEGLTYESWFVKQPEQLQRDLLGDKKFALWKSKKIGFEDLIDSGGNPLSIEELEARFG